MSVAHAAKELYETELRPKLEDKHRGRFISIEPISKSFFLGDTFLDAALAAKSAFPDRKSFVLRVGYDAAFHLGAARTC